MKAYKTLLIAVLAVGLLSACSSNRRAMDTSSSYETGASSNTQQQYQPAPSPEPIVRRSQSK